MLERRGIGAILVDAVRYFLADWRGFILIGVFVLIPQMLNLGLSRALKDASIGVSLGSTILSAPLFSAARAVVDAALITRLLASQSTQTMPIFSCLSRAIRLGPDVFAAVFRGMLIATALFYTIVGAPWGISRFVRWAFITQAVVVDGQGQENALNFSSDLVKGHWWITFGRLAAVFCVAGIFLSPVVIPSLLSHGSLALQIGMSLMYVLVTPFTAIAFTLMYFDLKARKAEATVIP